jgi:thiol-disulfide isomerase/thioredoxin
MKKNILTALAILLFHFAGHPQGIKFFKGSLAEAKAEAGKQHKLIFVDCYATWCGPCNKMGRDIFPLKEVGDFYNGHFVCYKLDMEKGEGKDFAKAYDVKAYPTYLYLNDAGELAHRTVGSKESVPFIEDGRIASDPARNLRALATRFTYGERDTALLKQLAAIATDVEPELSEKALAAYWTAIPEADIPIKENWELFKKYEKDINSKAYKYISGNKQDFVKLYGAAEVDNALYSRTADAMRTAADTKNEGLLMQAKSLMKGCTDRQINTTAGLNELRFYRKTERWKEYIIAADKFLNKFGDKQETYNSVAWEIFSHSDDHEALEKGLGYAAQSMKLEKNYGNSDTYANLLYKLKRYKEAAAAAKESIKLAKKEKLDYTSTQELLDNIEKSMAGAN